MFPAVNKPVDSFAASNRARFSTAEFLRMVDADVFEDERVELIDGQIERMQRPKNVHAARQAQVVIRLAQAAAEDLVRGDSGLDLGDDTFVVADAALLRVPVAEPRWLTPADLRLVVEVAETTRERDLGVKQRKYAAAGVPAYWVVDGTRGVVHVFDRPDGEGYLGIDLVRFGEPLAVPGSEATITLG